jgi:hypothetical protein
MPLFELQAPDGSTYEIEGANEQGALAALKKMQGASQPAGGFADTARDVAGSIGTGLVKGSAALATTPMAIKDMLGWAADQPFRAANYLASGEYKSPDAPKTALDQLPSAPRADDVVRGVENYVTGPLHKPEGAPGKIAETVSEFVPAAVAGPGNLLRNIVRYAFAPGVASEGAANIPGIKDTKYEPWARAGGAVTGLGVGALASRPSTAEGVIGEAMGRTMQPADIQAAQQLVQDAAQRGITLTWPEAIQQATNSATKLGDVQRVAEASQRGGAVLRPVMAERPGQVDQAIRGQIDQISPNAIDPFTVGPRTAEAATGVVNDVRGAINNHTRPLYDRAQLDRVPDAQYQVLANDPRYQAALDEIRGHPEIGPELAHLPDNAVPVVDQAKKLLQTRSEVTPMSDATERYLGSLRGTAGGNAANAATNASPAYAQAVAEQARLRGQYLAPLEQGPVGRAAAGGTTEGIVNALLPDAPLAGSAPQTGQAFRAIGARDADAASNVVRQKMEGALNQSARDLQGGPNEWGGANYRAKLYGNPQAQENLQAAITETAGPAATTANDRLMEVLQATGRRQHPGSQTEFNKLLTRSLENGGPIGEVVTGATKFNPMTMVRDRYQQWRYGANTERLADLLIDPTLGDRLGRLSTMQRGSPQNRALIAELLSDRLPREGTQ